MSLRTILINKLIKAMNKYMQGNKLNLKESNFKDWSAAEIITRINGYEHQ